MRSLRQVLHFLFLTLTITFRLFIFIDNVIRACFTFIEKSIQIIKLIHGWIQMLRSILSAIHIIIGSITLLLYYSHQICRLLSILFQPLSNRSFERCIRFFSNFLFYYCSSDGACYTLQARTRQFVGRVRARWKKTHGHSNDDNDDDIYYAVSDVECEDF